MRLNENLFCQRVPSGEYMIFAIVRYSDMIQCMYYTVACRYAYHL